MHSIIALKSNVKNKMVGYYIFEFNIFVIRVGKYEF
jgi:hypothetical protein